MIKRSVRCKGQQKKKSNRLTSRQTPKNENNIRPNRVLCINSCLYVLNLVLSNSQTSPLYGRLFVSCFLIIYTCLVFRFKCYFCFACNIKIVVIVTKPADVSCEMLKHQLVVAVDTQYITCVAE